MQEKRRRAGTGKVAEGVQEKEEAAGGRGKGEVIGMNGSRCWEAPGPRGRHAPLAGAEASTAFAHSAHLRIVLAPACGNGWLWLALAQVDRAWQLIRCDPVIARPRRSP